MSVDQPKKNLVYISGNIPTLPVGSAEIAGPLPSAKSFPNSSSLISGLCSQSSGLFTLFFSETCLFFQVPKALSSACLSALQAFPFAPKKLNYKS